MAEINGCGSWWMPRWMKDGYYEIQCNTHDRFYTEATKPRFEVDKKFLKKMIKIADTDARVVQALTYYLIVRALGWTSYGSKK